MNIPIIVLVSIAIVVCIGFWYVWWNQHKLVNDLQQIKLNLQVLQTTPPEEKKLQQLSSVSPSHNPIHQNQVEQHHVSENEIYQSENNQESSSDSDDSSNEDSYSDDDDDLEDVL